MDESNSPARSSRIKTSYMAQRDGAVPGDDDPLLGFAPVPHKQKKRNCIGPERQRKFIATLAASGIVTDAARAVGASMEAFYRLRNKAGAEEFRAAWDAAVDRAMARVEGAAVARAIEGEERLVVSAGQVLGTERRWNESLVTFLLRKRKMERYGDEIGPGHPLYERIRGEVLAGVRAKAELDEEEVYASITRKLTLMRERHMAAEQRRIEERAWNESQDDEQEPTPIAVARNTFGSPSDGGE
jgi:hypothetical protein